MGQSSISWRFGALSAALVLTFGIALAGCIENPLVSENPVLGGTLEVEKVPKFVTPLNIPEVMPTTGTADNYEIVAGQTLQQILPGSYGKTLVWGYGPTMDAITYPGRTIEATAGTAVTVKWINGLVDGDNRFLPHILPVDQTLHWANPPGVCTEDNPMPMMSDCRGTDPNPYLGPVPVITHLHGAHVGERSDGFPEAWYLPAAVNIPAGYTTRGTMYDTEIPTDDGAAVFIYPNDQRATTLWYHDHSLGMTRTNVYAGLAGFYLLRGGAGDLATGILPSGKYEIPLLIQDRSFNSDGSLFYPDSRSFFDGLTGPYIPALAIDGGKSDVSPIWNPEFFGNTMVVNGGSWPYLNVEPRRYRFRIVNGSDSRFLILAGDVPKKAKPFAFWQIGADGGFLPAPEKREDLLLGPAERADVIVDFSAYRPGDTITLVNIGPDEPFGGGVPGVDFAMAHPGTTGKVMQFKVVKLKKPDTTKKVAELVLPAPPPLPAATFTRRVSLNEEESATVCVDNTNTAVSCGTPDAVPAAPTEALLGIIDAGGFTVPKEWMDEITENPALGATEYWEIYNLTEDAHPIHIHLVQFEIIGRQALALDADGMVMQPVMLDGAMRGPDPGESGRKDTVIVYPGEMARIKAHFDIAGLFVWHCHILSHEDNEMMRPYRVGP
ncbi:MAG: multicopper oxidase [Thermodesulfobacteriota bacterium]